MAYTLDDVAVEEFSARVTTLYQQETSLLRDSCTYYSGNGLTMNIPTFGSVTATVNKAANAALTDSEVPAAQVAVTANKIHVPAYFDSLDQFTTNVSYRENLAKAVVAAAMREVDDFILTALDATASSAVTMPTANTLNKAGIAKLASLLMADKVPMANRTLVVSVGAWEDMIADTTLTSSDYMKDKAIADGYFTNVLGFKVIPHTETKVTATPTGREVYAFHKDMIALYEPAPLTVKVNYSPDKDSWVVLASGMINAGLVQDKVKWAAIAD